MKEILFGWITKPYIMWNLIDDIFCTIEILMLIYICIFIYCIIDKIKQKRKKNGEINE